MEIIEDTYYNRYDLVNILGVGSYGTVLLSKDKKDGMLYAVKELDLNKEIISKSEIFEDIVKNISSEVNIIKTLSYGPDNCNENIVCYYDMFKNTNEKKIYIVTEYIIGITLTKFQELLKTVYMTHKSFYLNNIRYIITEVLKAIEYINDKNVIHGDIKPDNIMIEFGEYETDDNGYFIVPTIETLINTNKNKIYRPVLIDFGLSCITNINNYCEKISGTPLYMAPEIVKSDFIYKQYDIWSLGIVLSELTFLFDFYNDIIMKYNEDMWEVLQNITQDDIPNLKSGSKILNKLLKIMLIVDYEKRPTAHEIITYEL